MAYQRRKRKQHRQYGNIIGSVIMAASINNQHGGVIISENIGGNEQRAQLYETWRERKASIK